MNKILVSILFVLLLCSALIGKNIVLPDWFYNVPQVEGYLYAIGVSDECSSREEAHALADSRAQAMMSIIYSARVYGEVRNNLVEDSNSILKRSYTSSDTKVISDLISEISIQTEKRFDFGKYVSISLCKMNLDNVYTVKDVKVFARAYSAEKQNEQGINFSSYLELFAYGRLEALYDEFKAHQAFKELEEEFNENDSNYQVTKNEDKKEPIEEIEINSLLLPPDKEVNERKWIENPLSSFNIYWENVNGQNQNSAKYNFKSKAQIEPGKKGEISSQIIQFPDWYLSMDQGNHNSYSSNGSGSLLYSDSNLSNSLFLSVLNALSKTSQYDGVETSGFVKRYPESKDTEMTSKISFDSTLRLNYINLIDFSIKNKKAVGICVQLNMDKENLNDLKLKIQSEEALYNEFKKSLKNNQN